MKAFIFGILTLLAYTPPVFSQPDDAVTRYDRRTGMQTEREADLKQLGRVAYSSPPEEFIRRHLGGP